MTGADNKYVNMKQEERQGLCDHLAEWVTSLYGKQEQKRKDAKDAGLAETLPAKASPDHASAGHASKEAWDRRGTWPLETDVPPHASEENANTSYAIALLWRVPGLH